MPIYEYRCRGCGRDFEKYVAGASTPPIVCPACDSADVARTLSVFGLKTAGEFVPSASAGACCGGGCACH